jgi:GT2 family glycosyltransferase
MSQLGIVAIGRNEGDRLRRCLASVVERGLPVVYVDSGSTDGSVELARAFGTEVVELDMSQPFTAARARNAGLERLEEIEPGIRFVQFVDGDCEVIAGWLEHALAAIEPRPKVAAVSGRRRERFPERSIYNRLAEIEWDAPIGEAKYCSGDVLIRVEAFRQIGGYNPTLIAGEDPELSVRLRQHGWTILRSDAEMTLHDMAMTRFSQWWKRCERSGFAFAEGAALHGKPPERHWVRQVHSTAFWGIALPLIIIGLAWPTQLWSLGLALTYPLQVIRIARRYRMAEMQPRDAWLYSAACVLGRFPNAVGMVRYWYNQLVGRRQALIEHKGIPPGQATVNHEARNSEEVTRVTSDEIG